MKLTIEERVAQLERVVRELKKELDRIGAVAASANSHHILY